MLTDEQFMAVQLALAIIPALVECGTTEEELDAVKTFLMQFEVVTRDAITAFDKNRVDTFLADVANGIYGKEYKATLTRIHQPKGRKAAEPKVKELTPAEKLAALQAKLVK